MELARLIARLATRPSYETFLLPANQSYTHFENISWAAIHSGRELASYDWDHLGGINLQQCELFGSGDLAQIQSCFHSVLTSFLQTTSLGNAYGVCVMFVTFFDTCMVSLAAMFVWRISPYIVFLPWLTIACLDGTFLSSALTKVPDGAWFTITLAAVLAMCLLLWRFGKEQQWFAEAEDRFPTSHYVTTGPDGQTRLADRYLGLPLSTTRGFGIFFDKAGETTPIVLSQFLLKLTAMPEVIVLFHLRPLEKPLVPAEDRHTVSRLAIPHCYRLVVRYGYNDEIITPDLASVIFEQIRKYLIQNPKIDRINGSLDRRESLMNGEVGTTGNNGVLDEKRKGDTRKDESELAQVENAYKHKVLYIMGKEQMKIKHGTNYARRVLLWMFLWIRDNTRTKMANLRIPTDKVIEVGFLKEI